jgi:hypothetical protein
VEARGAVASACLAHPKRFEQALEAGTTPQGNSSGKTNEITGAGGRITLVQVYTLARVPAESWVTPLTNAEVDAILDLVRRRTSLVAEASYGPG